MLHATSTPAERRAALRAGLDTGRLLRFPGALNPMSALLVEQYGFEGLYVSGAVLANDLCLPDIGLSTQTEVVDRARQIARVTNLPALVDVDTGFGGALNVARTIQLLEDAGIAACQVEDQVPQKRCGHLDGKELVAVDVMVTRIRAAVAARRDRDFVIVARTDAVAIEGLDSAIERARAYVEAGADVVFPEALTTAGEFATVRAALDVPLMANMTEFGKSPLLDVETLDRLGYNIVIYPVTLQRLAMAAVERGLTELRDAGTQEGIIDSMQTRARLYEVIEYVAYDQFQASAERETTAAPPSW